MQITPVQSYEVTYENMKDWSSLKELDWRCNFKYGPDVMITGYGRLIFGEVVLKCKHKDYNVIGIEYADGDFITYNEAEMEDKLGGIYIKPLAIVEGKAVYQGDKLWRIAPHGDIKFSTVDGVEGNFLVTDESYYVSLNSTASKLSWNKPQETKEVQEPIENPIHDPNKFKVGDKVKVVNILPTGNYSHVGWCNAWNSSMDCYLGETFLVKRIDSKYGYSLDDSVFRFPSSALELVVQEKECTTNKEEVTLESLNAKLDKLIRQLSSTNESEMRFQKETKYS